MELSPKQQVINEIQKAGNILLIGNKTPNGDTLGSLLALYKVLEGLGKKVQVVVSGTIDSKYNFLPFLGSIDRNYNYMKDKIIRIDTSKVPVEGMKWKKEDNHLDIYLEAKKNLKFEFIDIINGQEKPDLICVLDSPDLDHIDNIYQKNSEMFFEVPTINIDHHSGNEYFAKINYIDLTATSTAEILVSVIEALGAKIDDAKIATLLLTGIIDETESFKSKNTTPKSLTVAAQLLAAGAKQQEIVKNLFEEPQEKSLENSEELLVAWDKMVANLKEDQEKKFAWTKIDCSAFKNISNNDIFDSCDDLLKKVNDEILTLAIICCNQNGSFCKVKSKSRELISALAENFNGESNDGEILFELGTKNLDDAENILLKRVSEILGESSEKEIWDVISEEKGQKDKDKDAESPKKDAIDEALKSLSQKETDTEERSDLVSIKEIIKDKQSIGSEPEEEIDVFDEEDE